MIRAARASPQTCTSRPITRSAWSVPAPVAWPPWTVPIASNLGLPPMLPLGYFGQDNRLGHPRRPHWSRQGSSLGVQLWTFLGQPEDTSQQPDQPEWAVKSVSQGAPRTGCISDSQLSQRGQPQLSQPHLSLDSCLGDLALSQESPSQGQQAYQLSTVMELPRYYRVVPSISILCWVEKVKVKINGCLLSTAKTEAWFWAGGEGDRHTEKRWYKGILGEDILVTGVMHLQVKECNDWQTWRARRSKREVSEKAMALLPGESQGQRSLVGCHLWGHTESDMTEAT